MEMCSSQFFLLFLGRIATLVIDAAYCYRLSSVVCLSVCLRLWYSHICAEKGR